MTTQLDEIQLQKRQLLKALRANIRLKYSLLADEELNQKLPEVEAAIDLAIQNGKEYELDLKSVLET